MCTTPRKKLSGLSEELSHFQLILNCDSKVNIRCFIMRNMLVSVCDIRLNREQEDFYGTILVFAFFCHRAFDRIYAA